MSDAPRHDRYDAIVVGGSFAGLSAAMQLARARRRVLVVDAGRPRNRFSRHAHGFLGHDGRSPADILAAARAQVLAYPTAELRADEATDASVTDARGDTADDGRFVVSLASGATPRARRLVLASGIVDELPDVPGVRERWGVTVLHCPYCHGYEVADGRLGVLAVSEGSLHQALLLPDWSGDVTLFTNGAVEPTVEQHEALRARGVRIDPRRVVAVEGEAPALVGVRVRGEHRDEVVALDALFVGSRTHLASPLASRLGCAFDDGPFGPVVRTDAMKETTVPGVFAAGDLARVPHNVTWASADGVTAGIAAHRSLVFGPG